MGPLVPFFRSAQYNLTRYVKLIRDVQHDLAESLVNFIAEIINKQEIAQDPYKHFSCLLRIWAEMPEFVAQGTVLCVGIEPSCCDNKSGDAICRDKPERGSKITRITEPSPVINGGLYVEQSFVTARRWNATWIEEGYIVESGSLYYDCETIYFAVKVSWDKQ